MRKILLLMLILTPSARAADIYFANAAAGSNNGSNCANAFAWTDVTNGINVATQQASGGNGNKLHLCATITAAAAGTNGIVAAASGSSALPVIVFFEPNAILQSPAWPGAADGPAGCGGFSAGGAIVIQNFSNWIVDLGTNGIIRSTANGTGLANTINGMGISFSGSGDNFILRNGTIGPIYQRLASAGTNDNGGCSAGARIIGGQSTKICNVTFISAFQDLEFNMNDSGVTVLTALPSCQSNTFAAHSGTVFNNTMKDMNRGAFFSGAGSPLIANNDIQLNSDNWAGNFAHFHSSGFFIVGNSSTTFKPQVVANYCHGTQTSASPTGCFYSTDGNPSDGSGNSVIYIRNIAYGIGGAITCCQAFSWTQDTGDPKGTVVMYFNTIINTGFGNEAYTLNGNPTSFDHRNNIYIVQSGASNGYFYQSQSGTWSFSIATFQGNDYFMGRAFGPFGMFTGVVQFGPWKTNCIAGSGTGCDSTSILTDPLLAGESGFATGVDSADGTAFYLTSASPARGLGDNLTSLCSSYYSLCTGAPQTFGAGGTCGSGCVAQNVAHPDAGAFPFNAGAGSVIHTQVILAPGTVIQ